MNLGDIFWLKQEGISHPCVVIEIHNKPQNAEEVVVCALTTNRKKANMPGNVVLDEGEVGLSTQSIIEVSKVSTVQKSQLGEFIGKLAESRVKEIMDGIGFLQKSFFNNRKK